MSDVNIDAIDTKLKDLLWQTQIEIDFKIKICYKILEKVIQILPTLLSKQPDNFKVRLSTLNLIATISSYKHECNTTPTKFSEGFLVKDEVNKKSIIDYIIDRDSTMQ